MNIKDDWEIKDDVSGLSIKVQPGKNLDKLHIENLDGTMNRDFWFTKDGEFDGTGSSKTKKDGYKVSYLEGVEKGVFSHEDEPKLCICCEEITEENAYLHRNCGK